MNDDIASGHRFIEAAFVEEIGTENLKPYTSGRPLLQVCIARFVAEVPDRGVHGVSLFEELLDDPRAQIAVAAGDKNGLPGFRLHAV
jgi:hypothetical protein